MSQQYIGGFITKSPPAVVGPTDGEGGSAPGVWTLDQALAYQKQGLWPKPTLQGQLWSWGFNPYGQLGLGNLTYYSSPKQVGSLTTWLNAANGYAHVAATKTDGTLWTWGRNQQGQLGLGTTNNYYSPNQVGALTTWLYTACGSAHTLAIKTDGTLWSWGANNAGQLGYSGLPRSSPVQVGALTNWSQIACGNDFSVARKTDGTLWTWGDNTYGQLGHNNTTNLSSPVQVGGLTNWSKISAGSVFIVATKTDGTIWSWGRNNSGQLGLSVVGTNYSSPKQIGSLTNWSLVSTGAAHALSIKTDGTLWAWGFNVQGQLGLGISGVYASRSSPVQVGGLTTWYRISCSAASTFSIKTDGTLWAWGRGDYGQLGFSTTYNYSSPKQVGSLTTWIKLPQMSQAYSTIAIKTP